MIIPGQIVNVEIWGRIVKGLAVAVESGEVVVDFPASGGVLRLSVPAAWVRMYVPKDNGIIQ